jgi:hypothetical protein
LLLLMAVLLMMARVLMLEFSVLCERRLRVKRLSSLVKRETASLKD